MPKRRLPPISVRSATPARPAFPHLAYYCRFLAIFIGPHGKKRLLGQIFPEQCRSACPHWPEIKRVKPQKGTAAFYFFVYRDGRLFNFNFHAGLFRDFIKGCGQAPRVGSRKTCTQPVAS